MKLLVQEFLENKTFGDLEREHGVYASFSKSGHKFSLNYDQIEAKESDPLSQECRGLILSLADGRPVFGIQRPDGKLDRSGMIPGETNIIAYPMRRFFNYGQGAANINLNDPRLSIMEKLDGSLTIVYYDPIIKQWCVATRSVPEADLLMDNGIFTFRTLFEKALFETNGMSFVDYMALLDKEITYCFELTTPYNRIVVDYKDCKITLIAMRRIIYSLDELHISNSQDLFGIPIVQTHKDMTMDELVSWVAQFDPMKSEGVVVRDSQFNRIKVKNPAYIAYNKLNDRLGASERNIMELILLGKDDDVLQMLPEEIVKNLQKIKSGLALAIKYQDQAYLTAKSAADAISPSDKKTFAILITKNNDFWTPAFFNMFDGKSANMHDFILKNIKEGTWTDSFLDKLLEISKKHIV